MRIPLTFALCASFGAAAHAAGPDGSIAPAQDAGQGFRGEGKPEVDDVFGDAADYQRIIDRFLDLSTQMSSIREDFARTVQDTLNALGVRAVKPVPRHGCPVDAVAPSYAKGYRLGGEYLRLGRELTRHFDQVREYDRLGETIGLTPDYRVKVRKVITQYKSMVADYREMKVAFHDQLVDELKYAGCDLWALLQKGDPKLATAKPPLSNPDEAWPDPNTAGAPGVPVKDTSAELPPQTLPIEKMPPPSPIAMPKRIESPSRTGVLFYVDNTKCKRGSSVTLDGKVLGLVQGGTRMGFQSQAGPHDLCLLDDPKRACGEAGTVRRSYLHEGWTITLRCD